MLPGTGSANLTGEIELRDIYSSLRGCSWFLSLSIPALFSEAAEHYRTGKRYYPDRARRMRIDHWDD